MCCFPSYNNIGFQPQILKKAGVGFASGAEAIHGMAVPRRIQASKLLQGLFSYEGFLIIILGTGHVDRLKYDVRCGNVQTPLGEYSKALRLYDIFVDTITWHLNATADARLPSEMFGYSPAFIRQGLVSCWIMNWTL
jgi:hypothetical protein